MSNSTIDILLATFNGEKYLKDQIDSILQQTYQNWKLIIHDDGSTDNTVEIIRMYASEHPNKIVIINDGLKTGGAKNNFSHLMQFSTAPYLMFCDQDDVWMANKIELTFTLMLQQEQNLPNKPILVHTDLNIVKEDLSTIHTSMFVYQKMNPETGNNFNDLIIENCITGCTVMINKTLLNLVPVISDQAVMHDWWLGLMCLKNGGKISYLPISTIYYRQHESNNVGAQKRNVFFYLKKISSFFKILKTLHTQAISAGSDIGLLKFSIFKIKSILFKVVTK